MYLQQIKYFPTPFRPVARRSSVEALIMITFCCVVIRATTNAVHRFPSIPFSPSLSGFRFDSREKYSALFLFQLPMIQPENGWASGGRATGLTVNDDVDDDERKAANFLWLYLFSNLTTIKYELLKVNSHLLDSPSNWSISQRPKQRTQHSKHKTRSDWELRTSIYAGVAATPHLHKVTGIIGY